MQFNELQKQTNTNIQEKANLIWESATHLVGLFKPHEYGKVILPMTVLKRFDDALAPTKQAVLEMKKKLDATGANEQLIEGALTRTSGYAFYNTSKFDFQKLLADPDNIADNFDDYLKGFSANVADIISRFEFANTVGTMVEGGVLFVMIQEFNSAKADSDVKKFKKYAKDNSTEMFVESLFPDKFKDIVTQCFLDNNEAFQKLFNDPDFYQKVQDEMAKELYKSLRKS